MNHVRGSVQLTRQAAVILVIDSGVGGLSVCRSILAQNSSMQIIYFADDAFFPYGELDEKQLTARLIDILSRMLVSHSPDLVVLACNTVSTLLLPELRERFSVPFVGVVPAIKPAAMQSSTKHIGLLATTATIARDYTDALIQQFASDCQVTRVGTSHLVVEAENLLVGRPVDERVICDVVAPFLTPSSPTDSGQTALLDTIVLGCTHFPLLADYLSECLPNIAFIDSGDAIAMRVSHLLDESGSSGSELPLGLEQQAEKEPEAEHQIYFSNKIPDGEHFKQSLVGLGFKRSRLKLARI